HWNPSGGFREDQFNPPVRLRVENAKGKWLQLFAALKHDSATVCVVVSVAYVDHCLWALLGAYLAGDDAKIGILTHGGCVGDLSAKAKLAFCLGLISKGLFNRILLLCTIRNSFAHKLDVTSFDSPEVVEDCSKVQLPLGTRIDITATDEDDLRKIMTECLDMKTSRGRFTAVAAAICTHLAEATLKITPCTPLKDVWDSTSYMS
ncbi:MAG TPA: hypothetical protein VM165_15420, partial [Planctomycetaceae bacterium]|nr:hypothetical protein [Planctomycetaceae bacterium]